MSRLPLTAFEARYEMTITEIIQQSVVRGIVRRLNNRRIRSAARQIALHAPEPSGQPVAFFKASTGIDDLSWNSGFHLLASWALRLEGVPVAYFACHAGMSRCVLGTNRDRIEQAPPCRACTSQSRDAVCGCPGWANQFKLPRKCIGSRSTATRNWRRPWPGWASAS